MPLAGCGVGAAGGGVVIRRLLRRPWVKSLFQDFHWYRRMYGGHWERWFLFWHHVDRCSLENREHPAWIVPACEHHAPTPVLPQGQAYRSLAP